MSPAPFPAAGRAPRRARYLVPRDLPRRNELIAAAGLLVVAAHLLFAPLTIVLAGAFHAVSRVGRFSPRWLWAPAVAGLAWALAAGPAAAVAGFAARPRAVAAV
ncbi:MAG: hypothetical protein J2P35_03935, partial [Actinobacteria bacterium]|nr:hypothetical protein [Actinomycetota bacterium]